MINQKTFIFTALDCEARALVVFFELKKDSNVHPFIIYKNHNFVLTVTGVGKVAMAGAVAYSLALFSTNSMSVIVNIGIVGHKAYPVGSLCLASKVVDKEGGKSFYPQLIGNIWPKVCEIITTSIPCTKYSNDCLHDMEASAFYEMAVKFSSSELIHCIKIVSDNETSSIEQINAKSVAEWIASHKVEIGRLLAHWTKLQASIVSEELEDFDSLVKKWHFTVSGRIKLKSLLTRWMVLTSKSWVGESKVDFRNSKKVLHQLEADVNRLDIQL